MKVDVIQSYDAFGSLEARWNDTHAHDPEAGYFLSWRWLAEVFRANPDQWQVLAVRPDEKGAAHVCFFPLRLKMRRPLIELQDAGRLSWAQYTGLVCEPEWEEPAISALGERLRRMAWSRISLRNCSFSDRRLSLFLEQFPPNDFRIEFGESFLADGTVDNQVCPYIQLPTDFDEYLQSHVSGNTRQKIRRYSRRIEESDELHFTISDATTFEDDLDHLLDFWAVKWTPERGAEDVRSAAQKYREIVRQSFACQAVFLPVLRRGDTPLGALGHIVDWPRGRAHFIVAGRDETAPEGFIGLILHAYSIRWAIENGLEIYDFCHGNESYKYSFTASEQRVKRFTIQRHRG